MRHCGEPRQWCEAGDTHTRLRTTTTYIRSPCKAGTAAPPTSERSKCQTSSCEAIHYSYRTCGPGPQWPTPARCASQSLCDWTRHEGEYAGRATQDASISSEEPPLIQGWCCEQARKDVNARTKPACVSALTVLTSRGAAHGCRLRVLQLLPRCKRLHHLASLAAVAQRHPRVIADAPRRDADPARLRPPHHPAGNVPSKCHSRENRQRAVQSHNRSRDVR